MGTQAEASETGSSLRFFQSVDGTGMHDGARPKQAHSRAIRRQLAFGLRRTFPLALPRDVAIEVA